MKGTRISDVSVEAAAAALMHNQKLQSFMMNVQGSHVADETQERLKETVEGMLERKQLPRLWHELVRVTRLSPSPGISALTAAMSDLGFRRAVFRFLLP